jgi:hypothetical protein
MALAISELREGDLSVYVSALEETREYRLAVFRRRNDV